MLTAPTPLGDDHDLESFSCGEPTLDDWLRRQARRNEQRGTSRTYVVCDGAAVVGYYCLAASAMVRSEAPKAVQRNVPDPIPVVVLGRLATHHRYQGQGIGRALVRDATLRVLQAAEIAGIRAILVHALCDDARRFSLRVGFIESPLQPMTLCLSLETARRAVDPATS